MIQHAKKIIKYTINDLKNIIEQPIIVLLYHRVTDIDFDPQLLSVSVDHFREQLLFIKNNYEILQFEDKWETGNEPTIVITFDDGYADNYHNALPILEELEIPATFFISTGMIDNDREFWWDDLERLILIPKEFPSKIELKIKGKMHSWDLCNNNVNISDKSWNVLSSNEPSSRCKLYKDLHLYFKPLKHEERIILLTEFAKQTNQEVVGRDSNRALFRNELIKMASSKYVTIGAHTNTHPQLSGLSFNEQQQEIISSKEKLEKWLNRSINIFSYPFGSKTDYNTHSISICKKSGFDKVASNYPGQFHTWTDQMQIPRQIVRNWGSDKFKSKLNNFLYN